MKKILFSLMTLLFISAAANAQSGKDAYKQAKKGYFAGLSASSSDAKAEKLESALDQINIATNNIGDFDAKTVAKIWIKAGEINNELATIDFNAVAIGQATEPKYLSAPQDAYVAFKKAIEAAGDDKKLKRDKSDAVSALLKTFNYLDMVARHHYGKKEYEKAAQNFSSNIDIREILKANAKNDEQILATDKEYHDYLYLVGLAAFNANDMVKSKEIFTKLKDAEGDPGETAYEVLYSIESANDKEGALAILTEGREKFPDNEALRVKEINYYLNDGKLDVLVGKIKDAIAATPDNNTLYLTLGHVYDNLFQREDEAGNTDAAKGHFDNALKCYNDVLAKEANNHSALYNVGALYYNKAANMTKELITLESDFSKAGIAKYDAKKKEVFAAFDEALPYFQKAEAIDANDAGTLTALKEIFAKKEEMDKYNEFKTRLDKVQAGEKNDASYFK